MITPVDFDDLRPDLREALRSRYERLGYLGDFFRYMAHQPDALIAFDAFTEACKHALPFDLAETIALTAAARLGNDYERCQHERLAVRNGLARDWVAGVECLDPTSAALTPAQADVQRYVLAAIAALGGDGDASADLLEVIAASRGDAVAAAVALLTARFIAHATRQPGVPPAAHRRLDLRPGLRCVRHTTVWRPERSARWRAGVAETALWLTEADVTATVGLGDAVDAVRAALVAEHGGRAASMEKTALAWDGGHTLHALGGVDHATGLVATKSWAHTAGGAQPVLAVWDSSTGRLLAMIEAFALGQLRTASVSAVAIDALATPDAAVLAIIGTGKQALAQVAAAADRRTVAEVRVFSPTADHRASFAERLRPQVGARVVVCDGVDAATDGADIVVTATRARHPVLDAGMLGGRTLVVAVGAITPERAELDGSVAASATLVVSDSPATARRLSHELDGAAMVDDLSAVVAGAIAVPADGPRVFKAMGLGLADLAVGGEVLRRCLLDGRGTPIADRRRSEPRLFRGGST